MRIGYCKIGRSWNLDPAKASTVGGDLDVIRLLKRLALRNPEHEFFLIGRNSGENPQSVGFPSNVVNPWSGAWKLPTLGMSQLKKNPDCLWDPIRQFEELTRGLELDQLIMWVGQHGACSFPIPAVGGDWINGPMTNPQVSFINYASYITDFCNKKQIEPIFLVPDPRNYVKMRDLAVPVTKPVLAQYRFTRDYKQDFGTVDRDNGKVKTTPHRYIHSMIEMTALDDPNLIDFDASETAFASKKNIGLISNENRREVSLPRGELIKKWLLPNWPDIEIYGNWSEAGLAELGRAAIDPVPTSNMYSTLKKFKCTMTFPASGSSWVTSKVWECFASGVVCFIHPKYDEQGSSVPHWSSSVDDEDLKLLSAWLRVCSPTVLKDRVEKITSDYDLWHKIVSAQRRVFERRFEKSRGGCRYVEQQLFNIKEEDYDASK